MVFPFMVQAKALLHSEINVFLRQIQSFFFIAENPLNNYPFIYKNKISESNKQWIQCFIQHYMETQIFTKTKIFSVDCTYLTPVSKYWLNFVGTNFL